ITPFLLATGAGGIGWWRVRATDLAGTPAGRELRQAYLLHTIHAELHRRNLLTLLDHLRREGIEPLLVKGWAASRLYPDPALRPYGDIDLAFGHGRLPAAAECLARLGGACGPVDLHDGMPDLADQIGRAHV